MLLLLAVAVLAAPALAAGDVCSTKSVPVSVFTEGGQIVTDVQAKDVHAEVAGRPVPVTGFSLARGPYRSVLLVDTSASITSDYDERTTAFDAAARFARGTPSSLAIALLTFGNTIETRVGFGEGRDAVKAKIAELGAVRWSKEKHSRLTAIRDAVAGALSEFGTPRPGDSILLITDGDDNESRRNQGEVTRLLLGSGMRLFVLVLRDTGTPPPEEWWTWLAQVAHASGGEALPLFLRKAPDE